MSVITRFWYSEVGAYAFHPSNIAHSVIVGLTAAFFLTIFRPNTIEDFWQYCIRMERPTSAPEEIPPLPCHHQGNKTQPLFWELYLTIKHQGYVSV